MAKPNDPIASEPKPKRTLTVRRDKPAQLDVPTITDRVSVPQTTRYEMIATAAYPKFLTGDFSSSEFSAEASLVL